MGLFESKNVSYVKINSDLNCICDLDSKYVKIKSHTIIHQYFFANDICKECFDVFNKNYQNKNNFKIKFLEYQNIIYGIYINKILLASSEIQPTSFGWIKS